MVQFLAFPSPNTCFAFVEVSPLKRGYANSIPTGTMAGMKFGDIKNYRISKLIVKQTQTFLTNVSGGDIRALMTAISATDLNFRTQQVSSSASDNKLLNSIGLVISHLQSSTDEDLEGGDSDDGGNPMLSRNDALQVKALRCAVILSGVTQVQIRPHLTKRQFPHSSFVLMSRLNREYGLPKILYSDKQGRHTILQTQPEVLKKLSSHMSKSEYSTDTNVRDFKRRGPVRELLLPKSNVYAASDLIKQRVSGGSRSVQGLISMSSAYKYQDNTFVKSINIRMHCSDCTERAGDITFVNKNLGNSIFHIESVESLETVLGDKEQYNILLTQRELAPTLVRQMNHSYERLLGTQTHFLNMRYQLLLRSEQRKYLQDFCACLIGDFGGNKQVGHKRIESEVTQRNLTSVTVFACTLESKLPGSEKRIDHVVVHSPELSHSSFHACRYILLAVSESKICNILKQIHTLHCWNDNGRHLNSSEHATFMLHTLPTMFPNITLLTDNRHAAKHGKDTADATIKIGSLCVDHLNNSKEGYTNPKNSMSRLRDVLLKSNVASDYLRGKSVNCEFLFADNKTAPRNYEIIEFNHLDSSHSRKCVRAVAGGDFVISEHFRFDTPAGLLIPQVFVKKTRATIPRREHVYYDDIDSNVCKPRTHAVRVAARTTALNQIAGITKSDLSFITDMRVPAQINFNDIVVNAPVVLAPIAVKSRKRGRPKDKVDGAGKPNRTYKYNTLQSAIDCVQQLARDVNSSGVFPTSAEFTMHGLSYLRKLIVDRRYHCSYTQFIAKTGLRFSKRTKHG